MVGVHVRCVAHWSMVCLYTIMAAVVPMSINYWLDAGYWLVYSVVAGSMVVPSLLVSLIVLLLVVWWVSLGDGR